MSGIGTAKIVSGTAIKCTTCSGHGVVSSFYNYPEACECKDCNGSGQNWVYPNGTLAKYKGGPLLGSMVHGEV